MYGLPESLHAKRVTQSLPTPEPMPEMTEAVSYKGADYTDGDIPF